jgi:hypothetical protein
MMRFFALLVGGAVTVMAVGEPAQGATVTRAYVSSENRLL